MSGEWRCCGCVEVVIGGWGLWFAGKDLQPINGCRSEHSAFIDELEPSDSGEQSDSEVCSTDNVKRYVYSTWVVELSSCRVVHIS